MSDKLAGGIKAGKTSVSLPVELLSSTDSTAKTGVAYTDVTASYWRQGGTRTSVTPAALTNVNDSYSSGGWKEVDSTNMPGVYRFDVPDAAFATGADWVVISLKVSGAFALNFMFALESVGAAELSARIPTALTGDGNMKADMLYINGTTQTARDIGASVLVGDKTGFSLTAAYDAAKTAAQASDIPSAATVASSVWSAGTRSLTTFGTLVADISTSVWAATTRTLSAISDSSGITTLLARLTADRAAKLDLDIAESGDEMNLDPSVRVKLDASQPDYAPAKAGDGMVATQLPSPAPEGYGGSFEGDISGLTTEQAAQLANLDTRLTDARAGYLDKLNVGTAEQPVIVIPAAPADASLCRVYGYLETPDNLPAANVEIIIELVSDAPTKSERLISGRRVIVHTNSEGRIVVGDNPYVELQRNDLLVPSGTVYHVTCKALKMDAVEMTLETDLFNFSDLATETPE